MLQEATSSAPMRPPPRRRRPRSGQRGARRRPIRHKGYTDQGERLDRPSAAALKHEALSASSTKTRRADDRLASPREASTKAASALTESPRSAAMRRSRRQNASSMEMLVRWPAMTSECLTTRACAASLGIGASDPAGLEVGLRHRPFPLDKASLGLRAAKEDAILLRDGFLAPALSLLSRAAQIDDFAQASLGYFLRKASIETTFASPSGSAGFSAR